VSAFLLLPLPPELLREVKRLYSITHAPMATYVREGFEMMARKARRDAAQSWEMSTIAQVPGRCGDTVRASVSVNGRSNHAFDDGSRCSDAHGLRVDGLLHTAAPHYAHRVPERPMDV
jgi:hypothetical protein